MTPPSTKHSAPAEYVLGTDEVELARLAFQHRLWAGEAAAHWERAGFAPGQTLVDIGCGPGFATRDLAQLVGPRGKVIALDESPRYIESVRAQPALPAAGPIDARLSDVQRMGLRAQSVDGCYARWVLSFTPHPEHVVAGVARALRPGGVFAIQDYCHWASIFWAPHNKTLKPVRDAVIRVYESRSADSSVGQRLPAMMEAAGLIIHEIVPLVRIARPGDALWEWPGQYFRSFLPRLVAQGALTQQQYKEWEKEWELLEETPGAYFFSPLQVQIIAIKAQ